MSESDEKQPSDSTKPDYEAGVDCRPMPGSVKPKYPPNRFTLEGFFCSHEICSCGSTLRRKGCIQPNCMHYFKGCPSEDYNSKAATYLLDGTLDMYYSPNDQG